MAENLLHGAARVGVRVEVNVNEVLERLRDGLDELVVLLQLTHQQLLRVTLTEGQAVLGEHVEDDPIRPDCKEKQLAVLVHHQ